MISIGMQVVELQADIHDFCETTINTAIFPHHHHTMYLYVLEEITVADLENFREGFQLKPLQPPVSTTE